MTGPRLIDRHDYMPSPSGPECHSCGLPYDSPVHWEIPDPPHQHTWLPAGGPVPQHMPTPDHYIVVICQACSAIELRRIPLPEY